MEGKGVVCPYGILIAAAMPLKYSCDRPDLASAVEEAIGKTVKDRLFTAEAVPSGGLIVSADELGMEIASHILSK